MAFRPEWLLAVSYVRDRGRVWCLWILVLELCDEPSAMKLTIYFIFLNFVCCVDLLVMPVHTFQTLCLYPADQRRWRSSRVLQRPQLVPDIAGADEVRARPIWPCKSSDVPYQPRTAAGNVHRGQERLYRDQVPLTFAARRYRQCRDKCRLCSRGNRKFLQYCVILWQLFKHTQLF